MTLRQLEYFCAICRCGSVTRAAGELLVSQPSLSNAVRELEREFGVSLFSRSSHGLILTAEGAALREEAEALLAQAGHLTDRMARLARPGPSGWGCRPCWRP